MIVERAHVDPHAARPQDVPDDSHCGGEVRHHVHEEARHDPVEAGQIFSRPIDPSKFR